MSASLAGILLLVVAGVMNGSFTLPMKFTRQWEWENTWLVYTVWALVIFPPLLAWLTVPGLGAVYTAPGAARPLLIAAVCGAAWGVGQIFFGLAVEGVGIALAFSVILGLSAALGSLLPLWMQHQSLTLPLGVGVALVLVGVALCAVAGRRREASQRGRVVGASAGEATAVAAAPAARVSVALGLLFCVFSGVGSALQNVGFTLGKPLQDLAAAHGAAAVWAPNAIWLPLMLAGGIPGLLYCLYLVRKRGTAGRFRLPGTGGYWGLAAVMAVFWFASTALYGISVADLGSAAGWPVFMSLIVIVANLLGLLTGEWKGAGRSASSIMYAGTAVLIVAIVVISR